MQLPHRSYYYCSSIMCDFMFLAFIRDLFSRQAISYCIAQTLEASLCLLALRMALTTRNPPPKGIHRSDRGVQYASQT